MHTKIILFGEVLFDHFPDGSQVLGGAPLNVARHLAVLGPPLGFTPQVVSRVGRDPQGVEVVQALTTWDMDTLGIQEDPGYPTGQVRVELVAGEPRFHIEPEQAYDYIEPFPVDQARCLYHGSLALRQARSRETLLQLRESSQLPSFLDLNLRPPWWQPELARQLLEGATWVKLNQAELEQLSPGGGGLEESARALQVRHRLRLLVVTLGAAGALALPAGQDSIRVQPAPQVPVVDTVGAGDAFAAVLLLGLLAAWPLAVTLERAQALASAMVGVRGATVAEAAFYAPFLRDWGLI